MSQNTFQKLKLGKILNRLRTDTDLNKQQKDLAEFEVDFKILICAENIICLQGMRLGKHDGLSFKLFLTTFRLLMGVRV